MSDDIAQAIIKEEIMLEKFDGEPDTGTIAERIYLVDGELVKHEFYDKNGELERTLEGGN